MPYQFITLGQAKQALSQQLYDISEQFFTDAELGLYINEALQVFNAIANFYRADFAFDTAANQTWYDLTTVSNSIRPITTTDQNLLNIIQYHLLEPQSSTYPLAWTGSNQFSIADILNSIQQMRDQCLSEANCTATQSLVAAPPGRIVLPHGTLGLRRVCWIPVSDPNFSVNCLLPSDLWATQSYEAGFPQLGNGTPQIYRRSTEPPPSFDVDIQPAINGQYDIVTIAGGGMLVPTAATVLPVPNDWSWVIKFGALAQLFDKESAAKDVLRAKYCDARFKHGVALMSSAPALLGARINDVPVQVEAVSNGDFYYANWQGMATAQPQYLFYTGLNLLGAAPIPNGQYGITASVIGNMSLPVNNGSYLQVGRDDINSILDYAQHLAMLKCGGAEFEASMEMWTDFVRHCTLYNSKLKAMSPWIDYLDGRAQEELKVNPVFDKANPQTVNRG
jgi:hypothetical protein